MTPNQTAFLCAYALVANVTEAAKIAKLPRSLHYRWMEEAEYAAAFATAHQEACETIEAEIRRRAVDGVEEPVIYQGELQYHKGKFGRPDKGKPLTVKKRSDVLLIFLAKALMPQKYRENVTHEIKGELKLVERLAAGRQRLLKSGDGDQS